MVRARVFAIGCRYPDAEDLDALRRDPAFELACGRLPEGGADLASQLTLSRLENAPDLRALLRLGYAMIDLWCQSHARPPRAPRKPSLQPSRGLRLRQTRRRGLRRRKTRWRLSQAAEQRSEIVPEFNDLDPSISSARRLYPSASVRQVSRSSPLGSLSALACHCLARPR
jgi:hypothetical protein